jgi:hypothetical protein
LGKRVGTCTNECVGGGERERERVQLESHGRRSSTTSSENVRSVTLFTEGTRGRKSRVLTTCRLPRNQKRPRPSPSPVRIPVAGGPPHVVTWPSLSDLLHPLLMPPCPVRPAVLCSSSTDALMRALVRRSLDTRSSGDIPSGQQAAHGVGWARLLAAGIFFLRRDFNPRPKFELLSSTQSSLFLTIWKTFNSRRCTPTRSVPLLFKGSDPVRQDSPRHGVPSRNAMTTTTSKLPLPLTRDHPERTFHPKGTGDRRRLPRE